MGILLAASGVLTIAYVRAASRTLRILALIGAAVTIVIGLLLFFGLAILLSVTTILGTWETQREGTIPPPDPLGVTAKPAAK